MVINALNSRQLLWLISRGAPARSGRTSSPASRRCARPSPVPCSSPLPTPDGAPGNSTRAACRGRACGADRCPRTAGTWTRARWRWTADVASLFDPACSPSTTPRAGRATRPRPYFYLPKLRSMEEAVGRGDGRHRGPPGSLPRRMKATVLIETYRGVRRWTRSARAEGPWSTPIAGTTIGSYIRPRHRTGSCRSAAR